MNSTQSTRGPLARLGHRIATVVAECTYAQNRVASSQHTPEHF
jgi:hypothetical protein